MRKSITIFILPLLIIACSALTGEEIARLSINKLSSENNLIIKEATLDLKKGDEIAIWSDMDYSYEGDSSLLFKIEILKDGVSLESFVIDPTDKNITINEVTTSVFNKTNSSFSGKNSEIEIEEDGTYTFKGFLFTEYNSNLEINKAEIVLKR
ncbi:hypothetical protein GCM10022393_38320 [Aquimarina addita]|uniref:Lipoprotein n=1 Tax=Aquimarina addita TaxID=870485 RepID=A0ABP6UWC6_9FLAO